MTMIGQSWYRLPKSDIRKRQEDRRDVASLFTPKEKRIHYLRASCKDVDGMNFSPFQGHLDLAQEVARIGKK